MSEQVAAYVTKKKPFAVTDEASAEWVLEKLEENAKARALVEEQYERMISRHEAWREDALKEIDGSDAHLQSLLRPWAEAKLADGKKKSVKLPSGRVGFRAGSKTWKIGEEKVTSTNATLLAFVKNDDDSFVKVEESVRWGDYKKTLNVTEDGKIVSANGEIIPWMTCTQGEPVFYVEVTGG